MWLYVQQLSYPRQYDVSVARLLEALLQHTGRNTSSVNNNIIIKKIKDNPQAPANARADAPLFDGGN